MTRRNRLGLRAFWRDVSEGLTLQQMWSQFRHDAGTSVRVYTRDFGAAEAPRSMRGSFDIARAAFWAVLRKLSPPRRALLLAALLMLLLGGIARAATAVSAPAERTWETVVDMFAVRGVPIRLMDSDKGRIATHQVDVNPRKTEKWAECGKKYFGRYAYLANRASYEVFIAGDSVASTVRVVAHWASTGGSQEIPECRTTGVGESEFEAEIKRSAEAALPREATPVKASASRAWDAVVDVLESRRLLPIETMDRDHGSIAIDESGGGRQEAVFRAYRGTCYVVVRGDSAASTLSMSIRWSKKGIADEVTERTYRTKLETALLSEIKADAESTVARGVTPVAAPVGRTWDAVTDAFASRGIPIRTMERAAGYMVSNLVVVDYRQAAQWAKECGTNYLVVPIDADRVIYSAVVRGNDTASTVRVRARWTHGSRPEEPDFMGCGSRHVRERELEDAIKLGAETTAPGGAMAVGASVDRTLRAVSSVFTNQGIPILTWDQANGFVATEHLSISGKESKAWADCGKLLGMRSNADRAIYNVFVRGDSAQSTVRVAVHWTDMIKDDPEYAECTSTNVRESELEAAIKASAEGH